MKELMTNIEEDIEWRTSQIAIIKLLPLNSNLNEKDVDLLIKNSIPIIYSLWEGFLKNIYSYLHKYIDRKIKKDSTCFKEDIHVSAYILNKSCKFEKERNNIDEILKHVEKIFKLIDKPYLTNSSKYKGSSFNYNNIEKLLSIFSMHCVDEKYRDDLDEFLKMRNRIAHGDRVRFIEVNMEDISKFSEMIINLMYDIFLNIEKRFGKFE
ncbi:MAG: hypothetical protein LBD03_00745 [Methanobrevibacter sp.]|jgi:preprotein translocase subunit SecA|nr:hypothetical protein [Candidatus Methanovirga procula]